MPERGQHCSEETRRRISETKISRRPTHCKRGHEFTPETTQPDKGDGRRRCKVCANIRSGELARQLRRTNPDRVHNKEFLDKHGITLEQRARLIEKQGNVCAACGTSIPGGKFNSWQLDHDHKCCPERITCGQCVRGLLCGVCNQRLGYLEATLVEALVTPFPQLIGKPEPWTGRAMRYLKKYATTTQETQCINA